jgi:hypothetical protein
MKRSLVLLNALVVLTLAGGSFRLVPNGHLAEAGEAGKVRYSCPMHPFFVKDQPGICPICNMALVEMREGAQTTPAEQAGIGEEGIPPGQRLVVDVATYRVDRRQLSKKIVAEGTVTLARSGRAGVELDISGTDLHLVRKGQPVEVMPGSHPGRVMTGRVAFIGPLTGPGTVKVLVELANAGQLLKPRMPVKARLTIPLGNVLAVPATAIQGTGTGQFVWVKTRTDADLFVPREIRTGARVGELVQVVDGLLRGDTVASDGAEVGAAPAPDRQPASHRGHGPDTPGPGKNQLDMSDMNM